MLHPYVHRGGVTIDTSLRCDVLFLVTWLPLVCKFAYLSDHSVACARDCRAESVLSLLPTSAVMEAEWKLIQQKTFTRWCNEHLRHQGMIIDDLEVDLSDGLRLIALLEVLSQKKMKRFNKKPRMRAQKLENVQFALDFISSEKIKLVNIGTY